MTTPHQRIGFALLTALWVITAGALLATAGAVAAREATASASNRETATRAFWEAHDCGERARSIIDRALDAGDESDAIRSWRTLDRLVVAARELRGVGCDVRVEAAGSRLDVNVASEEQLRSVFQAIGRNDADALVDALVDWRDTDDIARPLGAESAWYDATGRASPRNGPFADVREIGLVRGLESTGFDSLLTTESARLSINSAPLPVLASVPGLSAEVRQRIAEQRPTGRPIDDILALEHLLSPAAARELRAHYPDIARLTTVDPEAWFVIARSVSRDRAVMATIELRLVRVGRHAIVLRRRSGE
jgi:type II secretory pathway component PulK